MAREKRHRKPGAGAHVRLVPELDATMRGWLARNGGAYRYYGQRLGIEPFGAALIAWFLTRPEREQHAILTASLGPLEEMERAWNREMDAKEVGEAPPSPAEKPGRNGHSTQRDPATGQPRGPAPRKGRRA